MRILRRNRAVQPGWLMIGDAMHSQRTGQAIVRQTDVQHYAPHPIANLLPEMEAAQLVALTESVRLEGLVHDIVLFEGKVLDGRARQEACRRAGELTRYREFPGSLEDARAFIIAQNVHR